MNTENGGSFNSKFYLKGFKEGGPTNVSKKIVYKLYQVGDASIISSLKKELSGKISF